VSKIIENNDKNSVKNNNSQETNDQSQFSSANLAMAQQQMLLAQMQQNQTQEDEIDLAELWRAVWAGKITIILMSFIFAVASIYFALSQPNIYKASTILAPTSSEGGAGGLSALTGQFGGLASMAGINLGGGASDKTDLALEILKSRTFIQTFIEKHNLLVPIMAGKDWDMTTNTLILNHGVYDQANNKWLRKTKAPKKAKPSLWEAFVVFSNLLNVSQDKNTSMITVELEYFSPEMAQQWLSLLISDVNEFMREQDQKEARDSINYLTEQLEEIHVASMETVFYQLIEDQTKNMMLTKVKTEYVLKTIDPAQIPEKKAKPKRALIVVIGTILGGVLSVLIVLIRYFIINKKN
jgi:uncharacterized protein involved in exopolysaccharide biosynthesis